MRIKACPHWRRRCRRQFVAENSVCRRKVRLSPNSATVAVVSPFSATVALFCDSVDRALDTHHVWSSCGCPLNSLTSAFVSITYIIVLVIFTFDLQNGNKSYTMLLWKFIYTKIELSTSFRSWVTSSWREVICRHCELVTFDLLVLNIVLHRLFQLPFHERLGLIYC